jgi:hypothetical protein
MFPSSSKTPALPTSVSADALGMIKAGRKIPDKVVTATTATMTVGMYHFESSLFVFVANNYVRP